MLEKAEKRKIMVAEAGTHPECIRIWPSVLAAAL